MTLTNRPLTLLFTLLAALAAQSCKNHTPPDKMLGRTVILYINADNNLYNRTIDGLRYGALEDINEMEMGWRNETQNELLVYINGGTSRETVMYRIRHDEDMTTIKSPVIHKFPASDASKPETLSEVIALAREISPTQSYGLILWSHATGWVPKGLGQPLKTTPPTEQRTEGISSYTFGSSDSYGRSEMEINDLAKAIPSDLVLDFIATDACYMGGVEAAYELRNACRFFVASSVETPIDGFEYQEVIVDFADGRLSEVVRKNYENYKQRSDWWQTCAMSVVDCSKLDALAAATKALTVAYPKPLSQLKSNAVVQDLGSSSTFRNTYYDFGDFVEKNWASTAGQSAEMVAWRAAMTDAVMVKYYLPINLGSYQIDTYSGFSSFVPKNSQPKALAAYRESFGWSTASGLGLMQ